MLTFKIIMSKREMYNLSMLTYFCLLLAHWVIGFLIGYDSVTALCVSLPLPLNINAALALFLSFCTMNLGKRKTTPL